MGLGNPGSEYEGSRHNAGADAVSRLAGRHGGHLRNERGLHAQACSVSVASRRLLLAVPTTFMNESGRALVPLVRRAGLGSEDLALRLVVVHDELDLPSGRVKVKAGGGAAGNNGLKSIIAHLHTNDFVRIRIGIGKPPGRQAGADYVLRRPGSAERQSLELAGDTAADAVEVIAASGVEVAMNRFNVG